MDKPPEMVPSHLATDMSVGALWRGNAESAFEATGQPFFEVDAIYGRPLEGHSRTAYDAFAVRLRFGGGSAISDAKVRGRLLGQPMNDGKLHFAVSQSYDYQLNDAYGTGSQSFEGNLGLERALSSSYRFAFLTWGGLTVLGAVDSLPLGVEERPEERRRRRRGGRCRPGRVGGAPILRLRSGIQLRLYRSTVAAGLDSRRV